MCMYMCVYIYIYTYIYILFAEVIGQQRQHEEEFAELVDDLD